MRFRPNPQHTPQEIGFLFESEVAKLLGGKLTPGSGAKYTKGDVITPAHVVECKYSTSSDSSIVLQTEWFAAICHHALSKDKTPLLVTANPMTVVVWAPLAHVRDELKQSDFSDVAVRATIASGVKSMTTKLHPCPTGVLVVEDAKLKEWVAFEFDVYVRYYQQTSTEVPNTVEKPPTLDTKAKSAWKTRPFPSREWRKR